VLPYVSGEISKKNPLNSNNIMSIN